MNDLLSRQEMFDRAWRGLKSQGFQKCMKANQASCAYRTGETRCAWGWVDTDLTDENRSVADLHNDGIGLAAKLQDIDLKFAQGLQVVHDNSSTIFDSMERNLIGFADRYNLTVPND